MTRMVSWLRLGRREWFRLDDEASREPGRS
jgi:hypothetical protein